MNRSQCIFCVLTCNRPFTLRFTLRQLSSTEVPVIVIDDSSTKSHRVSNRRICEQYGAKYHGPSEQNVFLNSVRDDRLSPFISSLGSDSWTTGFNRNYTLALTSSTEFEFLVSFDDDIVPRDITLSQTLDTLSPDKLVGAELRGMPDHSIVGYITHLLGSDFCIGLSQSYNPLSIPTSHTNLDVPDVFFQWQRESDKIGQSRDLNQDFPVTGGFFGTNVTEDIPNFTNYYNEDWVWISRELRSKEPLIAGEVFHLPSSYSTDITELALKQEYGEIIQTGLRISNALDAPARSTTEEFWEGVLTLSKFRLKELFTLSNSVYISNILKSVEEQYSQFLPGSLSNEIKAYRSQRAKWREVISDLQSKNLSLYDFCH